jgi:hypothetical protein
LVLVIIPDCKLSTPEHLTKESDLLLEGRSCYTTAATNKI